MNPSRLRTRTLVQRALYPDRSNLTARVISGVAWQFGLSAFRVALTVASTAILARLLTPTDYGLVAMTTLVVEVGALLANLGFGAILVQKQRLNRLDLDTAFWVSLGIGVVLVLFVGLASYPAAMVFDQPTIVGMLWVSALAFIFQGILVVPTAVLHRLLLFRTEVLLSVGQLVARAAAAILLAWLGAGYWSLVIAPLIAAALGSLVLLVLVGYRPRLRFNRRFLETHWKTSGSYLGSGVLHYLLANFDYFVVGRRFGPEQLGFYQIAYSLPDELRNRVSGPLQRVLFPAYSLLQNDLPAFRRAVARSQKLLSAVVLPAGAGLALVAKDLVPVLYGESWLAVIPLLQILACGGALRALFSLVASIYYAVGRPDLAFKISLISAPFVVVAILLGSVWGVLGVAWAMIVVMVPSFFAAHFAMRLIEASVFDFLLAVRPAVMATLAMAVGILFLQSAPFIKTPEIGGLFLEVVFGALLYAACLAI
uniref:lipopolysaccharide biosynthesis protein n=1 Tax=Accumulibacter sp. TaxID=2053492 RepID=UPI0028C4C049